MSKKRNAELYGIRFDLNPPQGQANSQWLLPPLGWINKDNDWYLVEFFTPYYLVNGFPWLINQHLHQAWKVNESDVLNNPTFRVISEKSSVENTNFDLSSYNKVNFKCAEIARITGLIYILSLINKHPSFFYKLIVTNILIIFFLSIALFITRLFLPLNKRREIAKINDFSNLNTSIKKIKENSNPVMIEITNFRFYTLPIFFLKLFLTSLFCGGFAFLIYTDDYIGNQTIFHALIDSGFIIVLILVILSVPIFSGFIGNRMHNSFKVNLGKAYTDKEIEVADELKKENKIANKLKKENAKVYGIRFNLDKPYNQWLSQPLAWLNKDDEWYLVEFFTPKYLANGLPWLIDWKPHRAWKVSKEEVLDNDVFRLNSFRDPDENYSGSTTSGRELGKSIGNASVSIPTAILAKFFSTHDHHSYFMSIIVIILITTCFFLIEMFLLKLLGIYVKKKGTYLYANHKGLEDAIKKIKENDPPVMIKITKSNAYSIIMIMLKLIFFVPGVLLMKMLIFDITETNTVFLIEDSCILSVIMSFVYCIVCLIPMFIPKGHKSIKTKVAKIYPFENKQNKNEPLK